MRGGGGGKGGPNVPFILSKIVGVAYFSHNTFSWLAERKTRKTSYDNRPFPRYRKPVLKRGQVQNLSCVSDFFIIMQKNSFSQERF